MKATYKLLIVRVKVKYPACIRGMPEHIWQAYIDGLIQQESKPAVVFSSNDYDKVYLTYQQTKIFDNIIKIDNKQYIETQVYYFVQCKYINNKLEKYEIQYSKYPTQNIRRI